MVEKFAKWVEAREPSFYTIFIFCIIIWVLSSLSILSLAGCNAVYRDYKRATVSDTSANAIPAAIQYYEVPIEDTSTVPDILHLRPGQSAMLLKDVIVVARIPYNGNELYVGEVKIQKGTMLVKPKEEY